MARDDAKMADFDKELEDWCFEEDCFLDREQTAFFLTSYLVGEANARTNTARKGLSKGFVLNLNAEWGAGKTTFLKCWRSLVKARSHPVVYVDAWRHDFIADPLPVLLSDIERQLSAQLTDEGVKTSLKQATSKLGPLLKAGLPFLLKMLARLAAGKAADDFADKVQDILADGAGDATESVAERLLEDQKERVEAIDVFGKAMTELTDKLVQQEGMTVPVFVFIDELDRCRPTYAVEMLEVIKHLFNIPNWVFVLATNTNQLQHTVQGLYGAGFDAEHYFERFFDKTYHLAATAFPEPLLKRFMENHRVTVDKNSGDLELLSKLLSSINWEMRKKTAVLERFVACLRFNPEFDHFMLLMLIIAQETAAVRALPRTYADVLLDINEKSLNKDIAFGDQIYPKKIKEIILLCLCRQSPSFYEIKPHFNVPLYKDHFAFSLKERVEGAYERISMASYVDAIMLAVNFEPQE
ncbi:KAP family P-loop NTPase fold protein [Gallaecimonas pentaromativorans]|uniref:KAP-like P-loop domain-containing protein n=1 Tax=Gallaecimonas pentaromativorans TaxID=584787 RepID=A0A3N1PDG3_9GAMM|nr:P-loop NTPase fold protein [Gallaecimonas pentaromativorans]ROQ25047.1 KAP-like P-loop domain-containing protein [Gallaecimonas pentaromativorans]